MLIAQTNGIAAGDLLTVGIGKRVRVKAQVNGLHNK